MLKDRKNTYPLMQDFNITLYQHIHEKYRITFQVRIYARIKKYIDCMLWFKNEKYYRREYINQEV